jgi:hypothetical protein
MSVNYGSIVSLCDIYRSRGGRMTYQSIDVHDSNVCAWESLDNLCQVRSFVLENIVDQRNVLQHLVADLSNIARLIGPVLRGR